MHCEYHSSDHCRKIRKPFEAIRKEATRYLNGTVGTAIHAEIITKCLNQLSAPEDHRGHWLQPKLAVDDTYEAQLATCDLSRTSSYWLAHGYIVSDGSSFTGERTQPEEPSTINRKQWSD